jgi:hypothetical protein
MATATEIAEFYDLTESGDGFTGDCPCCGYRGFSLTEQDGRVLFYCHGGGCEQEEIIELFREADLWGATSPELLFEPVPAEPPKPDRKPKQQTEKSSEGALAIWRRSRPADCTVVETYLRARGYRGPVPPSLRYVTGGHASDDAMHPIMVAAVIRPDRPPGLIGVHRTFLLPDGSRKAGFEPNKMSLGPIGGGGVPLAAPRAKIAVSEGIETGLSFMQATGIPTWAALSAGGITKLLLPPDVHEVLIAADADKVGLEAAEKAASRWHAEGRNVRIIRPPQGLDFNDLARAS